MTLPELITTLQSWANDPKVINVPLNKQFLDSDFGVLAISGTDLSIDINNSGTLPDAVQGPPE